MMKVTEIKESENRKTQQIVELGTLLENMKTEGDGKLVSTMRYYLQFTDENARNLQTRKVPKVIFAASFKKVDGIQVMMTYNGIVLLEINGLVGMDEARAVRQKVSEFPQTMAAFIGSGGKSVKMLVAFTRPDGSLPQTREEAEAFQGVAYAWSVNFYRSLIPYSITLHRPSLEYGCRMSYDPELYFNPDAIPVECEQPTEMELERNLRDADATEMNSLIKLMPGQARHTALSGLFETSFSATLEEVGSVTKEEKLKPFLVTLAGYCFKSGIPEEDVVRGVFLYFSLKPREMEVRQTIHNVYLVGSNFGGNPCISHEQILAMQTSEFMKRRYEFRYNVQTTEVEYRERNSLFFDFVSMTERVLNSIAINALEEGLQLWDRDVKRYIYSNRVPVFSPIDHYLSHLSHWDGKDRIRLLAEAVPCENNQWADFFHRWFLCMVAHWRGMDKNHANSTSPLLIGPQGYNKSTFCLSILPPQLRAYYTDSIDFGRKSDAELYLNRFALINMDEFDQISVNHQAFLKHILQKSVVNIRKPHQTAVQALRRYASFIATSNHSDLLTDTSGSRRFICIQMTGAVKINSTINYEQLYAQALQEIQGGERYWFNSEEEAEVNKNNQAFQQLPPAEQLFHQYFRAAEEGEECEKLLAVEILGRLQKKSGFKLSSTKIIHFGRILRQLSILTKKDRNGVHYLVVER